MSSKNLFSRKHERILKLFLTSPNLHKLSTLLIILLPFLQLPTSNLDLHLQSDLSHQFEHESIPNFITKYSHLFVNYSRITIQYQSIDSDSPHSTINKPTNLDYCVNQCHEYQYRSINNLKLDNKMGYYVDLNSSEIQSQIHKLQKGGWFNIQQYMILSLHLNSISSDIFMAHTFTKTYYSQNIEQQFLISHNYQHIQINLVQSFFIPLIHIINLFYMLFRSKLLISYLNLRHIDLFTYMILLVNIVQSMMMFILNHQTSSLKQQISQYQSSQFQQFISTPPLLQYQSVVYTLSLISFMSTPFFIFSFLSVSNILTFFNNLLQTLFRTVKTIFIYLVIYSVFVFCYLRVYQGLVQRGYTQNGFNQYGNDGFIYLLIDMFSKQARLSSNNQFRSSIFDSQYSLLIENILLVVYMGLTVLFISFMLNSFQQSHNMQYNQFTDLLQQSPQTLLNLNSNQYVDHKQLSLDYLDSMVIKIDKFNKNIFQQTLLFDDQNHIKNRIVIYLENHSMDKEVLHEIYQNCEDQLIKLLIFERPTEILQFLKYLFQLKPNFMVKNDNFFRVVLDTNYQVSNVDKLMHWKKKLDCYCKSFKPILNWLQTLGTQFPVLIYFNDFDCKQQSLKNANRYFKKKYKYSIFSDEFTYLLDFISLKKMGEIQMMNYQGYDMVEQMDSEDTIEPEEIFII